MDRPVRTFSVAADYATVTRPSVGDAGPDKIMDDIDASNAAITKLADGAQHFLSLESPAEDDTRVVFRARADFIIGKIVSALLGSSTPSVTWKLQAGADLSSLVDLTPAITTTSVSTGDETEGGAEISSWTGPDGNGEYYAACTYQPHDVYLDGDVLTEGTIGALESDEYGWTSSDGGRLYLPADPSAATVTVNADGFTVASDAFLVAVVTATSGSPSQLLISLELEPA